MCLLLTARKNLQVSLKLDEVQARPDWLFAIDRTELPSAYAATVTDPLSAAAPSIPSPTSMM